ncbi:hypothetical protein [Gracilibacillus xinjiangensis]|uniref:Transporter n=1 Tax=Gracilibacillus xinjiangensis TaxID=1193282 RepID=A0ABV8WYM0_9BACI
MYDERQLPFFPFFPGGGFPPAQGPGQGQQGFPPFGPPQGQQGGAPVGPPPQQIPQQFQAQGPQVMAVDPGSIRGCLYRYTYIWLSRYQSFWFYPTYVGRRSVAGYRWTGFNWIYFGIDLDRIQSFACV